MTGWTGRLLYRAVRPRFLRARVPTLLAAIVLVLALAYLGSDAISGSSHGEGCTTGAAVAAPRYNPALVSDCEVSISPTTDSPATCRRRLATLQI